MRFWIYIASIIIINRLIMKYRNTVIQSLHLLEFFRDQIFTQIVNVASEGDMKEVLDVFEDGDYYTFDMDQFEDSKDVNVLKLIDLCHQIEKVYDSIQNINAVNSDELKLDMAG